MTRETKEITLPKTQAKVVLYTYITGGEKREITKILTANISADASGQTKGDIPVNLVHDANDKALSFMVVSIDGFERASDLPSSDFDYLVTEINKVTNDTDFLAQKAI